MEDVESKSPSFWWDSHIDEENSKWLAENCEGFEQNAKEILKLIEQDRVSSENTYDRNKSELIARMAEISRVHKVLADRYEQFIGEVRMNRPTMSEISRLNISDPTSPQPSQLLTPDHFTSVNQFSTPIGFDVLLNSGGGGGAGSESSYSLLSDSDSESFNSMNKLAVSPVENDALEVKQTKGLERRLEKTSNLTNEKVNEQGAVNKQTANTQFEFEPTKMVELQKQVNELQVLISESNNKMGIMGEELDASRKKLMAAEGELSSKISVETQLYAENIKVMELQEKASLYEADIAVRDDQIRELKRTHKAKEDNWKAELKGKLESIEDLNKKLDSLKQKYDILMTEKDGVVAQLDTLKAEMRDKDNLTQDLTTRLSMLQEKHAGVVSSFESAQKLTDELRMKAEELQREVDRQTEVISDRGEEKKEAIRQLCFSLEHYRSGYKELCRAYVGHKRRAGLAS